MAQDNYPILWTPEFYIYVHWASTSSELIYFTAVIKNNTNFLSNFKLSFSRFRHPTFAFSKTVSLKNELLHWNFNRKLLHLKTLNAICVHTFSQQNTIHMTWYAWNGFFFTVCKNKLNHTLCTYTTHRFVVMSNLEIIYSECLITNMNYVYIWPYYTVMPQSVTKCSQTWTSKSVITGFFWMIKNWNRGANVFFLFHLQSYVWVMRTLRFNSCLVHVYHIILKASNLTTPKLSKFSCFIF